MDYIAVNTDAQVLEDSLAPRRVQIGAQLTQGLGAGGDAAIGRQAAEEDAEEIGRTVAGADLVFIAAGLGGGTGSGAAPVIAAQARQAGALTVAVVTRPFEFEGTGRRKIADAAWVELNGNVDTLLVIENERVVDLVGEETSMLEAFTVVNEVLAGTVRAIVDIMTVPGLINLDFADVRAIMQDGGMATAGIGSAVGPDRAVAAAKAAVTNPLLDHDLAGAGAILLNVAGASGMTMSEVKRAAEVVHSAADPEAMIIFGTIFDDHLDDELRVTVIATRLRDDFAYVHRVAADTSAIAEAEQPAPAPAAVAAAAAVAASLEPEEEPEEEAPRWAAIPIVTSEDEPVPVAASGATAVAELNEAPEPFAPWAASQAYAARVEEAPTEPWAAAAPAGALATTVFAQSEPDQSVSELEPAEERAPAEPALSAVPDDAPEAAADQSVWFAPADEAPEPAAAQSWFAPAEAEAAEPEPAPAEQSWPAPASPPWYDPGDEALEAARSAATPVFTQPEEPEPATAPEPTAASAPPGNVVVSGQAPPRTPEPPPSQMARRTTQAVLSGVWKRLQKPPEPPR